MRTVVAPFIVCVLAISMAHSDRLEESLHLKLIVETDKYGGSNDQLKTDIPVTANPEEQNDFVSEGLSIVEGDIIVPLHGSHNESKKAISDIVKWPNGIVPLIIDPQADFTRDERTRIRDAILEFHQFTCIRFVLRTSEKDYLYITSHAKKGCASSVGKTGGKQNVYLEASKCVKVIGTILHELMHALGFLHEHSRADRDSYVNVDWNNVACIANDRNCGVIANDVSDNLDFLSLPYDYDSVLHFSSMAFSKDPASARATLIPRHTSSARIGQRMQLSQGDIAKIKIAYSCQRDAKRPTKFADRLVRERSPDEVYSAMDNRPEEMEKDYCEIADFMPAFGLRAKNKNYIGKENRIWEITEITFNDSTVFLTTTEPETIQQRFHGLLPKEIDAGIELDDGFYFFKDSDVWILSGQENESVLDKAEISQVFPGIPLPVKGVFKSSNMLTFSNGSAVTRYDLVTGRLQSTQSLVRLNQNTGWPSEFTSLFDIGRNRLLIFAKDKVYLTKENSFPVDYGYPKSFREAFCTEGI